MGYLIFVVINLCIMRTSSKKESNERSLTSFLVRHARNSRLVRFALIASLSATLIFGTVFGVSYIPRPVQQDLPGIEFLMTGENEATIIQAVNVRIDGTFRNGMFGTPSFNGYLELDAYPDTINSELQTHFSGFSETPPFVFGILRYFDFDNGPSPIGPSGFVHISDSRFSSVVIDVRTTDASQQTSQTIIAPESGSVVIDIGDIGDMNEIEESSRMIIAPATDFESAKHIMQSLGVSWYGSVSSL
jgi:hypothetical protein